MFIMHVAKIDDIEYEVRFSLKTGWMLQLDKVIEVFPSYAELRQFVVDEQGGELYEKVIEEE